MTAEELRAENEELRLRLEEAEETLRAIREGAVDALVVTQPHGHRVYTLEGADRPYRLLVEEMQQGAATLQADGTIVWCNKRLAELLRVPHEKLVGASFADFVAPRDRSVYENLLWDGQSGSGRGEAHLRPTTAGLVPAYLTFNSLPADCGAAIGVLVTDLTTQRHQEKLAAAHETLRASEARLQEQGKTLHAERELLRVTLRSIGDAVITTDPQGRVTFLNGVAEALTGWANADALGQPLDAVFRIVNEQNRTVVVNPAVRALTEGVIVGLANHTILIAKDGTERPIDDSAAPIRNAAGELVGCVLVFRDITERKRAEQTLERQAEMLRIAFDAIIIWRWGGAIVSWSQGAEDLYGFTQAEAIGRVTHELLGTVHPVPFSEVRDAMLRSRQWEGELRHRTKDGRSLVVSSRQQLVSGADGDFVLEVNRDISDRRRAEEALREADRRKNEFLAMLAHELRNPLAPISNAVQVMHLTDGNSAAVAATSEMMKRQVGQLVRLVDDLLDVSRISRGKIELRRGRVELASVVNHAVEAARSLAQCMEHELTVMLPTQPIHLNADPTRLAQVVGNLLNNACKFTEKGGRISLTVEIANRETGRPEAVIRVRDSGIGIAAEHLPRIFDMFTQVDTSLERSTSGLGIGLTLVKNLVEMHGGTVDAHSAGVAQGSEFVVRLPILVESAVALGHTDGAPLPTGVRRFLVVDDNQDSARSLAMLLRLAGHETHTAYDGLEAVGAAEQFRPEVVLLDIGLPKLNGYEACRRIREQPFGKSLVVVALTGWGQEEDRQKTADAGFNAHLVKPVNLDDLMKLLATLPGR